MLVAEMEPVGTEVTPIPRPKEPINVLTGIFLKNVYFLDSELTKCVIAGVFRNREDCAGILFKGKKGCVYWSLDNLNQFFVHFNTVTLLLEGRQKYHFGLQSGETIKVVSVFGKQHVFLYDGEHTLALNSSEWTQFINSLPAIYTHLGELALNDNYIKETILNILVGDLAATKVLPGWLEKRLFEDVSLHKRCCHEGSG